MSVRIGRHPAKINDLLRGKIGKFSLNALINMLGLARGHVCRVADEEGAIG